MCSALIRHNHVHFLGHDSVHVVHAVSGGTSHVTAQWRWPLLPGTYDRTFFPRHGVVRPSAYYPHIISYLCFKSTIREARFWWNSDRFWTQNSVKYNFTIWRHDITWFERHATQKFDTLLFYDFCLLFLIIYHFIVKSLVYYGCSSVQLKVALQSRLDCIC